jgi:hypothetical protein
VSERPAIVSIHEDADNSNVRVTITLRWEGDDYHGEASGTVEEPYPARLAGEATLRAVEHICGDRIDLELMAVATQELGPLRIALAQVRLDGDEVLVGNALVDDVDPAMAAARAVMDAINRRLGLIL